MRVNFLSNLKSDKGTLVFLCLKNKPLDTYLNNLNKKQNGYIEKVIKVSGMEYDNNSYSDIILPQSSNAERIILIGLDYNKY